APTRAASVCWAARGSVDFLARPHLRGATHDILEGGQLLDTDRPARVQAPGGDADLCAHAEFTAIGELGRGVVQNDRAVDAGQEALGRGTILGNNAIGVRGPVSSNMR